MEEVRASIRMQEQLLALNILPEEEQWEQQTYINIIRVKLAEENLTEAEAREAKERAEKAIAFLKEIFRYRLGLHAERDRLSEEEGMVDMEMTREELCCSLIMPRQPNFW